MKKLILCADDYGQNLAVSQAILQLLERSRLTATSCLVTFSDWETHAGWLSGLRDQVDAGLHFNLTEGEPLSQALRDSHGFLPLGQLLARAFLHLLDRTAIRLELLAQIDAFEAGLGMLPRHLDGHQHIHHFPVIRDVLLEVYEKRLRKSGCWLRQVSSNFGRPAAIKKLILNLSGATKFVHTLKRRGIPHNATFSGIYPFSASNRYVHFFPAFLAEIGESGLIPCHPGLPSGDTAMPLYHARVHEFRYLAGDAFPEDCLVAGVELCRFSQEF
jgi:predicted glycoside hydrolase/deacetylase ChbG (UPF0249 family)